MLHGVFQSLVPFVPFAPHQTPFHPLKLLDIPTICRVNTCPVMRTLPSCYYYQEINILIPAVRCPSAHVARLRTYVGRLRTLLVYSAYVASLLDC